MKKQCKQCKISKRLSEFHKHPQMKDGHINICVICKRKEISDNSKKTGYDKKRQRYSIKRIFSHRYAGMKQRVNGLAIRKYPVEGKSLLSKEEFIEWCYEKNNLYKFSGIYRKWEKSNFKRMDSPSINRIDDTKGYEKGNIEWLSVSDNMKEYHKNGAIHSSLKDKERDSKGRFKKTDRQ